MIIKRKGSPTALDLKPASISIFGGFNCVVNRFNILISAKAGIAIPEANAIPEVIKSCIVFALISGPPSRAYNLPERHSRHNVQFNSAVKKLCSVIFFGNSLSCTNLKCVVMV